MRNLLGEKLTQQQITELMKSQVQNKENNGWPTKGEHNGFITKLELLPNEADLAIGWFEFGGTLRNKDWTHKNDGHWSDVRTLARVLSAKYGFGFDEGVTLRQMVPILSAIIDAYGPIAISATFDGVGLRDIISLAKPPPIRIVPNPEPEPEAKVDMWDGWDDKYERMLTLPVMHGYGGDYQGFPHKDVIKCWVEKQDVPKGDKPVFLLPQKKAGFPNISENMATFGEGEAEKKRRYEFNQTRGKANG